MTPELYKAFQDFIAEHVAKTLPKFKAATSARFSGNFVYLYFDGELIETMPQEIYFKFMGVER